MILNLSLIVEGHGETEAVPALLRRIRDLLHPGLALEICRPLRIGRNKLLKPGEIERAIELAARRMRSPGPNYPIFRVPRACAMRKDFSRSAWKALGPIPRSLTNRP